MLLQLPFTLIASLILLGCATLAPAAILTLTPVQDAVLYEDPTGTAANGSGEFLLVGRTNQASNSRRRSLLQFDLSTLPAGAIITSATIQLHLTIVSTADTGISLYVVTSAWTAGPSDPIGNESTGVTAVLGDTTWLQSSKPTLWTTAGGDFLPTASATTTVTSTSGYFQWTSAALIADTQNWLANPASNYGWLLAGDETIPQSAKKFESSNSTTSQFRPQLTLEYIQLPEPTQALLLLALPLFCRRQRQPS